jgi:hypothetical protein
VLTPPLAAEGGISCHGHFRFLARPALLLPCLPFFPLSFSLYRTISTLSLGPVTIDMTAVLRVMLHDALPQLLPLRAP